MLDEIWQRNLEQNGDRIAVSGAYIGGEGLRFDQLDRRSREIRKADGCPYFLAYSNDRDFFPTLISAWRHREPVLVLDSPDVAPKDIRGEIPQGTCLIRQGCGASGIERSLFYGAEQVIAEGRQNMASFDLHPDRKGVVAISMSHSYGFGCLALPLLFSGVPLKLAESPLPMFLSAVLSGDELLFLPGVPALWKHWKSAGVLDAVDPSLFLAVSAGAPLRLELEMKIWESTGIKVHNFYGTSETGAIALDASETPRVNGKCVGQVLPGVEVRVEAGGQLLVRSPATASGADLLLRETEFRDEFYQVCDRASVSGANLSLEGDEGRAVNSAGKKISPVRVEAVCSSLPGVESATAEAIASRDPEKYQELQLSIRLAPGTSLAQVKARLYECLESWEMPRKWVEL